MVKTSKDEIKEHPFGMVSCESFGLRDVDTGATRWDRESAVAIAKNLRFFLDESLKSRVKCLNCGGIIPDLCITHNGKGYLFTCTRIEENGKVIAETDYPKLAVHLIHSVWDSLDKANKQKLEPTVKKLLKEWNSVFKIVKVKA